MLSLLSLINAKTQTNSYVMSPNKMYTIKLDSIPITCQNPFLAVSVTSSHEVKFIMTTQEVCSKKQKKYMSREDLSFTSIGSTVQSFKPFPLIDACYLLISDEYNYISYGVRIECLDQSYQSQQSLSEMLLSCIIYIVVCIGLIGIGLVGIFLIFVCCQQNKQH
jgi:hypothetical protein